LVPGVLALGCSEGAEDSPAGVLPFTPDPSQSGVPGGGSDTSSADDGSNSPSDSSAGGSEGGGSDDVGSSEGSGPEGGDSEGGNSEGTDLEGADFDGSGSEQPADPPQADADLDPSDDSPAADDGSDDGGQMPPVVEPPAARLDSVLAFTRTTGFRHPSIGPGVEALRRLGQDNGFAVQNTENPADFTDDNLARYDVVVWLNTDSEVLDDPARRAFERYIRAGGGWVGVHAASASEYGWAWYGQLLGGNAYFRGHPANPAVQSARVVVEREHASTEHLPQSFTLQDEWYSFRTNPRSAVQVLLTLDESSYGVGDLAMGDHPIAWYHEFDGGRAWYTALGHPNELYDDPRFTRHLLGGIRWAAGAAP
jgi:type 1 glutamine amidotransferase